MPRPHIEFLQAQTVGWSASSSVPNVGCLSKTLSVDPDSGASTGILRYPGGLCVDKPFSLSCDEELFVLDGAFSIGDVEYEQGDYAYLPAGHIREAVRSADGADVLTFYESSPSIRQGNDGRYDESQLIERLRTRDMAWGSASDAKVAAPAVGRKLLRPDTAIGERTWLLKIDVADGQRYDLNGVECHPCVEEMFLLDGDIAMTTGVLRSGAYFWRPPNIPHGPMGTTAGFVALFRAKEGTFTTAWSEPDCDIPWDAEYEPILPDELTESARQPYDATLRY